MAFVKVLCILTIQHRILCLQTCFVLASVLLAQGSLLLLLQKEGWFYCLCR
jgi:hypothetical protein